MNNANLKEELLPLTSIRFVSAFWVFLFHLDSRWNLYLPFPLSNIISQGPWGMSIFFILSGFILTYTYFEKEPIKKYKSFLIKRFARIYPVYMLVSVISLPFFVIPQTTTDIASVVRHWLAYFVVLVLNILLLQAWFPSLFGYGSNGGTWSLSVEFFFYLLFPLILSLIKHLPIKRLKILLLILYFFSVIPGVVFVLPLEPKMTLAMVYASPIYRLPEFIIGMVAAVIFINRKHYNHDNRIHVNYNRKLTICIFILIIYISFLGKTLPAYVTHNFFAIPIITLSIYYFANISNGLLYNIFSNNYFCFLGRASYSLYLMQILTILFVQTNYQILVEKFSFISNHALLVLIMLSFTLAISCLTYLFIENSSRKFIVKWCKERNYD